MPKKPHVGSAGYTTYNWAATKKCRRVAETNMRAVCASHEPERAVGILPAERTNLPTRRRQHVGLRFMVPMCVAGKVEATHEDEVLVLPPEAP